MLTTVNITSMSGPVHADEAVFVTAGSHLRALRSDDGSEQWTTSLPGGPITDMAGTGDHAHTGGFHGYVGPKNATSGEGLWEANVGPPVKIIAVDDKRVSISTTHASGAQIAAFSLSGDKQWTTDGAGGLAVADAGYIAQPSTTRADDRGDGTERWSLSRSSE